MQAPMNLLVNLDVDDLEKAIHFYGSAFGLTIGRRFGAAAVEMLGSPVPIYLLAKAPGTPASDWLCLARLPRACLHVRNPAPPGEP